MIGKTNMINVGAIDEKTGNPINNFLIKNLNTGVEIKSASGLVSLIANTFQNYELIASGYDTINFNLNDIEGESQYFYLKPNNKNELILLGLSGLLLLNSKNEKKKIGKIETKDILMIGAGVIGFTILNKILQTFGIWKSPETKALDNIVNDSGSFWNPNYYKQFSSYSYAITTDQAAQYAKQIYDSFGMFNDCEECVKGVFRQLRTKANVSFLSEIFYRLYGQDLITWLRGGIWPQDRLSDSDVNEINNFLSKLPTN